jgi:hypothetical protein
VGPSCAGSSGGRRVAVCPDGLLVLPRTSSWRHFALARAWEPGLSRGQSAGGSWTSSGPPRGSGSSLTRVCGCLLLFWDIRRCDGPPSGSSGRPPLLPGSSTRPGCPATVGALREVLRGFRPLSPSSLSPPQCVPHGIASVSSRAPGGLSRVLSRSEPESPLPALRGSWQYTVPAFE